MVKVSPEFDEAVRGWAGFTPDKWNLVPRDVKATFYDNYNKHTSLSTADNEEEE